jgi:ABC-2 type transport system ATP-binding protein
MTLTLSVRNLKKVYQNSSRAAVDGISFDVAPSEILGLLGPNGSGKTTTIQLVLGTLALTSGSILYFGKDLELYRSEVLQHVSYASSYTSLPWALTLEENLCVFGYLYGLHPKESRRRFMPLLERFGIINKTKDRLSTLSAGQITRLMLVKAFFIEPKIVLLDEPTASLDPDMASGICDFILEQRDTTGLSILFTSHKMEEASEICDRVIFLKDGKIVANDLPKNLASKVSPYRVRFLVVDDMERMKALVQRRTLTFTLEHRNITIAIPEEEIPLLLNEVGQAGISYASINIEEPSLEDYFLHMTRKHV